MMQSNLERNGQLSVICLNKDNDIDKYIIKSEKNHSKKEKNLKDWYNSYVVIYWCSLYDINLYFIVFVFLFSLHVFSSLVRNQLLEYYKKIEKMWKKVKRKKKSKKKKLEH